MMKECNVIEMMTLIGRMHYCVAAHCLLQMNDEGNENVNVNENAILL
jgi:hypothetical protein